jgi:hypothetical protein
MYYMQERSYEGFGRRSSGAFAPGSKVERAVIWGAGRQMIILDKKVYFLRLTKLKLLNLIRKFNKYFF